MYDLAAEQIFFNILHNLTNRRKAEVVGQNLQGLGTSVFLFALVPCSCMFDD